MNKIITLKDLQMKGACTTALASFESIFGEKAEVSKENVVKALRVGGYTNWLADSFLNRKNRDKLNVMWGEDHDDVPAYKCRTCREGMEAFVDLYNAQEDE